MKLSEINFNSKYRKIIINDKLLTCGYSRVFDSDYSGDQVTDPRPKAVSLGRWKSPKGNQLMAGINLNYLSDEQITRLQQNLQPILRDRNLKRRVRKLRALMPDIFNGAYRTYKRGEMHEIDPSTLKFVSVQKDPSKIDTDVATDVPRPQSAPNASIDADDVEMPQLDSDLSPEMQAKRKVDIEKPSIKEPRKPIQPTRLSDEPESEEQEEREPEDEI